jgi:hypothetical protein
VGGGGEGGGEDVGGAWRGWRWPVGLEVVERAAARRRRMKWRYCIEEDGRAEKGRERGNVHLVLV